MATELKFLKTINDISVYHDDYMEKGSMIVIYKSESLMKPGYVWIPTEIYNEGMATAKGAAIEKKEVDKILKMKRERNFSDIKGIVCNLDEKDVDEKMIKTLKKHYK